MRFGLKFGLVIATFSLTAALISAQSVDIDTLRRKAEAGDPKAQLDLAEAYYEGKGVPIDPAKGMEWLRRSAGQGFIGAEVVIGRLYEVGGRTKKDPLEAAKWYKKAARQGGKDAKLALRAQDHLSEMLAQGLISKKEADWRTPEPSSATSKHSKDNGPFSIEDIEFGLSGGITNKRMATLVETYGVDFRLAADARKHLMESGADDTLLAAIASSKR